MERARPFERRCPPPTSATLLKVLNEGRIDTVEAEAREARRSAAEDRQKITEMMAELRSTSRGVSRIEGLLDRMMMERGLKPP